MSQIGVRTRPPPKKKLFFGRDTRWVSQSLEKYKYIAYKTLEPAHLVSIAIQPVCSLQGIKKNNSNL